MSWRIPGTTKPLGEVVHDPYCDNFGLRPVRQIVMHEIVQKVFKSSILDFDPCRPTLVLVDVLQ